jgi:hypothetical protein
MKFAKSIHAPRHVRIQIESIGDIEIDQSSTSFLMDRKHNMLKISSLLALVGASISVMAFLFNEKETSDSMSVSELFAKVKTVTDGGDFESAIELVDDADVESVFKESCIVGNKGVDADKLVFLAFSEDAIIIPGVSNELKTEIWRQRAFMEIPGTGDDLAISDRELRRRWFDSVASFELKFNARVYRQGVAIGKFPALPLSGEDVRRRLHIDEATWKKLPIEIQTTLELLANNEASEQRKIDEAPSVPDHDHLE